MAFGFVEISSLVASAVAMANAQPGERTIEVWADTLSPPQPCKDARCPAKLIWAEIRASGRKMCFTAPAVPLREYEAQELLGPRRVAVFDFAANHWATCPGTKAFKRGAR